jgi:hypothetical protein
MSRSEKSLKKIKIGVYQLQPHENTANFVQKGFVKYGKNFDDEIIDLKFLEKENIKFKVDGNRIRYNEEVYFQFYKDNVASTYFTRTSRIPVFHCSVMFSKQIILANLINIYLYFNVENTKSYKSYEQLVSSEIKGTYELIVEYSNKQESLPFDKFTSIEDLVKDIVELLTTDLMKQMIEDEIERRNEERVQKYGKVDDYILPDKTINFEELVKKYEANNGNMDEIMQMYN